MSTVRLHGRMEGSGPLTVLLHPVGLDGTFWGGLPATLATRRRVLSLDLAGHGQSPAVTRPRPIETYADDITAAIREAGGGPAAVVGLSFGSMIAQTVAIRHPDLVSALIPSGSGGTFADEIRPMLRERGLMAERGGMQAVLDATIERWFNAEFRGDERVERVRQRLLADDVAGWSAGWHAISGLDATPHLGGIRVPTLVIAGENDVATAPAVTEATIAKVVPGARFVVLPRAPHMMQIETEGAYTEAIASFLFAL